MDENNKKSDINYCEKDCSHRHYWERVGIEEGFVYYYCTQCKLYMREIMYFVEGGN